MTRQSGKECPMHLVLITATASTDVLVAFIVVAAIVLVVMIGFFVVRWRQHRLEVRAHQITATEHTNPRRERKV
jgi:membrane protein YdbS with pleckstrin-like domain